LLVVFTSFSPFILGPKIFKMFETRRDIAEIIRSRRPSDKRVDGPESLGVELATV
jgi:hypothetical protein